MSKNTLKFEFVWKTLNIETQIDLDSKTNFTLAKFNVPSEWQGAQSQDLVSKGGTAIGEKI
jgi:hypothetical protein